MVGAKSRPRGTRIQHEHHHERGCGHPKLTQFGADVGRLLVSTAVVSASISYKPAGGGELVPATASVVGSGCITASCIAREETNKLTGLEKVQRVDREAAAGEEDIDWGLDA